MSRLSFLAPSLVLWACQPGPAPHPRAPSPPAPVAPAPPTPPDPEPPAPPRPPQTAETSQAPAAEHCGGFAGLPCPEGKSCVDDPNDDCDPQKGGADCMGVCVASTCADPKRDYRSRDPDMCARMKFGCPQGQSFFGDACGCGCLAQ